MFRRRTAEGLLAVVLAAPLAACGATSDSPAGAGTAPTSTSTSSADTAPPAVGAVPEQLKFTAQTVEGRSFAGESLAGKAAVLWFWAPWCPKCRAEAPRVAASARAAAGRVTFVGVAAQDELPAMKKFVADYGLGGFDHLADLDASIWTRFGVTYQPAYAFIKPDGTVDVVKEQLSEPALAERVGTLSKA
ncbi:redoxin domain-containing protein [Amycolatopsis sp. H6(2020)]|nr:redoxin domain-containing protein [Amycolatopsis sp. H6(2020)]